MKDFKMTEAQLQRLLDASVPSPMIMLQCGTPASPQEKANLVWKAIGGEMGFDYMTVEPTGEGDRFFRAEPADVTF